MPPLGELQTLSLHHHDLSLKQTKVARVISQVISSMQTSSPHHTLNPLQTATLRATSTLCSQQPFAAPQTTVSLAANPTLRTISTTDPSPIPTALADFDKLNARDGRTSPFDRATDAAHVAGIPVEIRVTAIELTVMVVFMVVLVVLLVWLFVMALDFALRYIRDRLEVEAGQRVDEEIVRRERVSEGDVDEETGLLRSLSDGRSRFVGAKKVSWAVERGRVRKMEKEIERRVREERLKDLAKEERAREDRQSHRAKSSAMEVDADGNPRRRSPEEGK